MGDLQIETPWTTVDDVARGLTDLEAALLARRDRRAIFVSAYRQITLELQRRIDANEFRDPQWVARYLVAFANLYRQALRDYDAGELARVPSAWKLAFDTAATGQELVIQDLILGINAHINHDLPVALYQVGIDPERLSRWEDHTAVNLALVEATGEVQDRIAAVYASGLGVLDKALDGLDETLTGFSFVAARDNAWHMGVALVDIGDVQRNQLRETIDRHASVVGRLVLALNTPFPWLLEALRAVERMKPWWTVTAVLAAGASREGLAVLQAFAVAATVAAQGPPTSLDEVIARLGELVARFDARRDRLSIYATVYRRITRKVKATVEAGGFQDPEWMTHLDLHFATRYFRYLEVYDAGAFDELPRSWAYSFAAVQAGRTMVVQDIVLQIAPRVVYDLPIALVDVGMQGDLEKKLHDYEKTYQLFTDELDDIQDMIARKYARLVAFEDALAGRLDEKISNLLYTNARREAWRDALALDAETSDPGRRRLITALDRKAMSTARQAVFADVPPVVWMCEAVRTLEDAFPGTWSELMDEEA